MIRENKLELNNKGTTLVELLIAVAIIAIISAPFVGAFVTATNVNTKSRHKEEVTTVATNVMEDIRGKSLAAVLGYDEFQREADGVTVKLDADGKPMKNLLTPEKYVDSVAMVDISAGLTAGGVTATSPTNGYEVIIDDADLTHVNGQEYVIKAYLDPTYSDSTSVTGADPDKDEYTDYNKIKMASIYAMNSNYDGMFVLGDTMDDSAVSIFSNGTNVMDVITNMTRDIQIDIQQKTEGGVVKTFAYAKVQYTYNGKTKTISDVKPIYSNTDGSATLRNLYIFFNPRYQGTGKEFISITNQNKVPCNIYLVKEKSYSVVDTETSPKANYDVTVVVNEVGRTDFSDKITTIRTNLINKNAIKQMVIDYSPTASKSASEVNTILDVNGLTDTKATNRAFNVVLNIYDKDESGNAKDLLFTFTGTKEN